MEALWCDDSLPVLGICGRSGSGKTTLLISLIGELHARKIKPITIKYNACNVTLDLPGKDSDRFFQSGSDVCLFGEEKFFRFHDRPSDKLPFPALNRHYDLVLVEGPAKTPVPKIWLLEENHDSPPPETQNVLKVFSRKQVNDGTVLNWILGWLKQKWLEMPVWGCVLIGGKSRRMGRPKHLIEKNGQSWLERTVAKLSKKTANVVLSGQGDVPASLSHLTRIPDVPNVKGPLAGLLAMMRWQPDVSWLITACDMPDLSEQALAWLLSCRAPGVRGVLPSLGQIEKVETLLSYYDRRSVVFLERIAAEGMRSMQSLADLDSIITPQPPSQLFASWRNVNSPDQL